jgi:hypothetical protein
MNLWTLEDLKSQIFIFFKQTDNIGNKQNGICFHDRLIDISLAQNCLTNWCCFLIVDSSDKETSSENNENINNQPQKERYLHPPQKRGRQI